MLRAAAALPLVALVAAACGGGAVGEATGVERYDSAGVAVVVNSGSDRMLAWSVEPVLRLGGDDEGPQAFHRIFEAGVAFDSGGALHVLDAGNHRVVVFGRDGRHLRTLGRAGSGPGEIGRFTSALAVDDDGVVAVFDMQRGGLTRWSAAGEVLETVALPGFDSRNIMLSGGRVYVATMRRVEGTDGGATELLAIGPADTLRLASMPNPPMKPVQFRNCPVQLSGMPAIFAPRLEWAGGGARIVTNAGPAYILRHVRDGEPFMVVRRDIEPQAANRELATRAMPDSMRIGFGTGQCTIPPEDVAEAQGWAPVVPLVQRLAVAPDGSVWVERNVYTSVEVRRIDVFDADGGYAGTMPSGTPWPAAFRSPDEFAAIERDDLELQHIVIYRIRRG